MRDGPPCQRFYHKGQCISVLWEEVPPRAYATYGRLSLPSQDGTRWSAKVLSVSLNGLPNVIYDDGYSEHSVEHERILFDVEQVDEAVSSTKEGTESEEQIDCDAGMAAQGRSLSSGCCDADESAGQSAGRGDDKEMEGVPSEDGEAPVVEPCRHATSMPEVQVVVSPLKAHYPEPSELHSTASTTQQKRSYRVPVAQCDANTGQVIQVWPSANAASKALSIVACGIYTALAGRCRTSGGFVWRRVADDKKTLLEPCQVEPRPAKCASQPSQQQKRPKQPSQQQDAARRPKRNIYMFTCIYPI